MHDSPEAFANLIARAREGDDSALSELVRLYEKDLRVAARVLLGPVLRPYLDSMDVVQSVHGSLIRGLRQERFTISTPEELLALVRALMRHKIAHHLRHLEWQQRSVNGTDGPCEVEEFLLTLTTSGDDPARAAQLRDEVSRLCDRLTPEERPLVEGILEGHSLAEIARRQGVNANTLRTRLSRLRQKLGVLFDSWVP